MKALRRLLSVGVLALVFNVQRVGAEAVRGQILDAVTKDPIEGVEVGIDADGDDQAELSTRTDTFGFYRINDADAGAYALTGRHPGYLDHEDDVSVAGGGKVNASFEMIPRFPGETIFDISIETLDVRTEVKLWQIPVTVFYFASESQSEATRVYDDLVTDVNGAVTIRGARPGYYSFVFNRENLAREPRPYWKEYAPPNRQRIDQHHAVTARLKPVGQDIDIHVIGCDAAAYDPLDPAAAERPLRDVYVEVTAIDPHLVGVLDLNLEPDPEAYVMAVLPTITGVTTTVHPQPAAEGQVEYVSSEVPLVRFRDLPAMPLKIVAKRFGYETATWYVNPYAIDSPVQGQLPVDPIEVFLQIQETSLAVELTSIYPDQTLLGVPLRFEGFEDSNTEGIVRTAQYFGFTDVIGIPATPLFGKLLPGRYRLTVDGWGNTPPAPAGNGFGARVHFRARRVVDVPVMQTTIEHVELEPLPAIIKGRLFSASERLEEDPIADELADDTRYSGPLYRPRSGEGIRFEQTDLAQFLPPDLGVVEFDTDADGEFTLAVLPGIYGIRIPTMPDQWGSNVSLGGTEFETVFDNETGEATEVRMDRSWEFGWPYVEDVFNDPDLPFDNARFYSQGVKFDSEGDYELDLFLREQSFYVEGGLAQDGNNPVKRRVLVSSTNPPLTMRHSDLATGGSASLTSEGGGVVVPFEPLILPNFQGDPEPVESVSFRFDEPFPPGEYTLGLSHPRHRIVFSDGVGGTTDVAAVSIPDLGTPGEPMFSQWTPLEEHNMDAPFIAGSPTATYLGGIDVEMRFYQIEDGEKMITSVRTKPEFFEADNTPGALFRMDPSLDQAIDYKLVPGDRHTVYFDGLFNGDGTHVWYKASFEVGDESPVIVEIDEENGRSAANAPPNQAYTLAFSAVSENDPTLRIPDVTFRFDDVTEAFLTKADGPTVIDSFEADYHPMSVTNRQWRLPLGGTRPTGYDVAFDLTGAVPRVDLVVGMQLGFAVGGTVEGHFIAPSLTTNKFKPFPGARVKIYDRFGRLLRNLRTDVNGRFQAVPPLDSPQVFFVEAEAPGFARDRRRVVPDLASPVVEVGTIVLDQIPVPDISDFSIDRFGPFLPGVRRFGNAGVFEESPNLTMTWAGSATYGTYTETLDNFDDADGDAGAGGVQNVVEDRIVEMRLIDPRGFPGNPADWDGDVAKLLRPANALPDRDDVDFQIRMQDWLDEVLALNNVFSAVVSHPSEDEVIPMLMNASGRIDLSELSAGEFRPVLVVTARSGALNYFPLEFDSANQVLRGLRLPPYLAFIADTLGTAKAIQNAPSPVQFDKIMPQGLIKVRPVIDSQVRLNGDNTLRYTFEVGINWRDGGAIQGQGTSSLAPRFLGLDATGVLTLDIDGDSSVSGGESATKVGVTSEVDGGVSLKFESYAPTAMTDTAKVTVRPFGSGALTVARKDIGGIPLELDLKRVTQAGIGVKAKFNIDRLVALIPVVGPFVDKLNRTSGGLLLDAYANTDAQISYDITTRFTTEYPHILERRLFGMEGGGSVALEDRQTFLDAYRTGASSVHAFRRHVLGGLESKTSKKQLERAICAAFKWGLELKTLKVFGAKGEFQLVGNVCRFRNARGRRQPAMKITLNEFGDWPPIRRIEGEFVGETELYLDMWIVKFKKKAKLFGIKFARELASEPSIAFTRMDISNSMLSPIGSPAVTVNPDDPATLIDNLYALARYAVSGGDESVLVFADIDPDSGGMILKAMTRDAAGGWGLPVTVSAAGGVVASDLISLPDGGHLLVWVEIDLDDLLDPFAASSLKYSVSQDGVNWETGTIAKLDGVATSLDLVRVEDSVAVLFLEGADGPISTEFDLKAAVYSNGGMQGFSAQQAGPSWSGTQTLLDDAFIGEWEGVPTSGADGLAIVYTDANGDLHSLEWDGAISSGPFEVVGGVRDVVTASGPDGESFLAWSGVDGDIQLMRRGESGWENLGDPLTTGIADNLAVSLVATDGTDALLAAWTEGSERTSIYHAFIGTDGVLITEPADLTMNSIGSYHDLRIVPEDASGLATVLAKFDGAATQLRAFRVSADGGGGDNDSDGDGLDDIDELRIVDADPDDAIRSVGDVRATDDFDNDGFDNGTEIASLTDAADAGLFPAQAVSITADVPETLEDGLVPAVLVVERLGDIGQGLTVRYSVGGTATAGEDYSGLSGEVTIAAGNFSEAIQVRAVPDSLDEGVEDVVVTLEEDAAYEIVGERSATASILEEPFVGLSFDGWLALHFTEEEILDPFVTGRQIDGDEDGYPNVVEYAFLMNPHIPDRPNIVPRIVFDAGTGSRFLLIELDRPPDSPDVDYLFEASDNLVEWEPVDLAIDAVTEVEGGQRVDLRDDAPLEELGKRFIRIRVVGN